MISGHAGGGLDDIASLFFSGDGEGLLSVPLDAIDADPEQPREHFDQDELQSLAQSLDALGLLQPVVLRKTGDGLYQLVTGERRLRAARLLGWKDIKATILPSGTHVKLAQLAENFQRAELAPVEVLRAVEGLTAGGLSTTEIAKATGVSSRTVRRYREILRDEEAVQALEQGESVRVILGGKKGDGDSRSISEVEDGTSAQNAMSVHEDDTAATESGISVRTAEEPDVIVSEPVEDGPRREAHVQSRQSVAADVEDPEGTIDASVVGLLAILTGLDVEKRLQVVEDICNRLRASCN